VEAGPDRVPHSVPRQPAALRRPLGSQLWLGLNERLTGVASLGPDAEPERGADGLRVHTVTSGPQVLADPTAHDVRIHDITNSLAVLGAGQAGGCFRKAKPVFGFGRVCEHVAHGIPFTL